MIDALDAVWLIDFATSVELPLFTDMAKFEMVPLLLLNAITFTADARATAAANPSYRFKTTAALPIELLPSVASQSQLGLNFCHSYSCNCNYKSNSFCPCHQC